MSSIRERLLGNSSNNTSNNSTIRIRLGIKDDYKENLSTNNSISGNNSTIDINSYRTRKKELEEQIANYDREEKVKWWDKDNNVIKNIGNVFYKALLEQQDNKYVEDKDYNKLLEEYKNVNQIIDDYSVSKKKYSNDIYGTADKFADVAAGSITTSAKGVESTLKKVLGQTPEPYTTYQEKLSNKALLESKGVEKVALDLWGNMVRMTPQMFTGSPSASLTLSFANYGGSAYNQAKEEGYSEKQATMYGATIGTLETALTKLLGGFEKVYGKSVAGNAIQKIMKKVISNPSLRKYITSVSGEFTEEYLQEFLDPIVRNVILEEENGADFWNASNLGNGIKQLSKNFFNKENLYAGALGALSSGIVDSPYLVDAYNSRKNLNNVDNDSVKGSINMPTVNDIAKQESNINDDYEIKKRSISPKSDAFTAPNRTSETDGAFASDNNSNTNIIENQEKIIKYTNHEIENFKNGKVKIATNSQDVSSFVESAKKIPSNAKLYFGKIGKTVANKIKTQLGIDVENYNISLKADSIKHILFHHSSKNEILRGQVPIVESDFNLIPEIVSNYDSVEKSGTTQQGKPALTFKKQIGDTYYLINYISNKNHNLEVQTMYKQKKKNSATVSNANIPRLTPETSSGTSSFYANNIPQSNQNVKSSILPVTNNMQSSENNAINMPPVENIKTMNPNEISKLTKEDANTTPVLPTIDVSTGKGESKFADNIAIKTNMLTDESKGIILSDEDVRYYQEVTNQESLEKAFERLNKNGKTEVMNWLSKDSTKADSTDVAEGWILLKQYQDSIVKETDLIKKNGLNRSMVQVAKKMREIGTKAGQTVQAFNILNRLTPEGMVYYAQSELSEAFDVMSKNKTKDWIESNRNKFELTAEETQTIMDIMKDIQQMEDGYDKRVKLAEIQKLMTDKLPPAKGAGIKAWMRISMLFNPKTQVRNVAGNAIIAPVNSFSDLFASGVDKLIAKKTGVRTTGTTDWKSYGKGFKKGAYESYNDFKKGINTRNVQGNRFEISEGKSFDDNTSIGKALNRVDSLLSFMLDAGDRTFYEASFTNSINNQLVLNNTNVVTQEMIDIATSEALSRTWQDNNNYTKGVLWVRNWLNNVNIKGYGLGDVLIPFAKTPANLTKAIVDYSPAGLVNTIIEGNNFRKSLTNGQYTAQMQHQFVQDLGKATAGTMLYVLGYALAKAGITSGESDDDKDVANFMKNTLGVNSYSIKIGNKSFTYDWAQPIAAPLSIMANYVNKTKQNPNASKLENLVSSLDVAGNIILEQSFMESINTVLSNNEGVATGIQEAILDLPARAIPTLMKQIADMIDPIQRTSFEYDKPLESSINSIKAKIPFVSKTLAPSVDTMGRKIQKYGGKNNIFNVFLNPANVNTENISESAKEIYRLYKSTGVTNIMPRVAPYYIKQNGEKIILNSEQRAKYQKISGELIEDSVKKLLKSSEYNNMSDKVKAETIGNIVNYSYNIAQKEVLGIELSDTYEKAYEYSQIGEIADYYSFKNSIDDTNKETKKQSISNYLINSDLKDNQIAKLYASYYSSEETLDNLLNANIPIKEFIKFNSQEFTTDYYENGKAITNSRKLKVINYINNLNLSVPQKAILIKMEYSSYDSYDNQIIKYINNLEYSKFEKASLLKSFGFSAYDKYLIDYVNNMNISKEEKSEMLEDMGFTIRNGKVYSK